MSDRAEQIVCAVRGSPQSRATVTRAIDLALEHDAQLNYFYPVEVEFLSRTTVRGPLSVVYRELIDMSEFTMLILKDRAERRGVARVDFIIREGDVRTRLLDLVREMQPEVLVLGWPLRGAGRHRFTPDEFEAFVAELEQAGNAFVEVVPALADK